ncbi:MAG: ArsR/SmtB family transcription factor [Haloplanus sp.]
MPFTVPSTRNVATTEEQTEEVLALLEDDYSRTILEAINTDARPACDLVDACDASRATVYRRLNRLEDAGLVTSRLTYDADGHHRTVFEATLDAVTVDLGDDGLALTVSTGDTPEEPVTGD